jgi:hypothetical protein
MPEETEKNPKKSAKKSTILMYIFGAIGAVSGISLITLAALWPEEKLADLVFPQLPSAKDETAVYSNLTGLPIAADKVNAPAYCIQTPNGTDGARPQAGLDQAGVVFEAIAEAGITRFAAIYQNPTAAVIGPIRSLRLYYLQWDTPFDCAIVHAGGADDAIEAVRSGGYKDVSENYYYMYRGTYGVRRWNNLFTNATDLAAVNNDWEFGGSSIKGFKRMTPEESRKDRVDMGKGSLTITEPAEGDTSATVASVSGVSIYFGNMPNFNVRYDYNASTNSYLRSYESGVAHEVYVCPGENLGEVNPEDNCTLGQLSPSVVVVMKVDERRASDNYHEDITTLGSGEAYIFQNGYALHGTWKKDSINSQIEFYDEAGKEIALAPGQTFVEAVPNYGSIEY